MDKLTFQVFVFVFVFVFYANIFFIYIYLFANLGPVCMDKTCPSLVIFSERWYEKIWPFARANSWQKRSQMLWLLLYYLTEMTRLGGQSVVRVEEISKKRTTKQYIQTSEGFTLGKGDRLLYIVLLKRGLIVLRPGPHECDICEPGYFLFFLFFTQIRADGALRVVWRAVSKRCGFGELNLFHAVKKNICDSKNIRIRVNRV